MHSDDWSRVAPRFLFPAEVPICAGNSETLLVPLPHDGQPSVPTGALDQQQQIFGRQAYVGFTTKHGKLFNVVTIGRQYDVAFVATAAYDPYGHGAQIFTAWDTALYGARFNNSIQDALTIGPGKILFQYSPGGQAGNNWSGTTLAGGAIYQTKPWIFGGTISHTEDASNRNLDVYGGGVRYTHGALVIYAYGYDTLRDPGFTVSPDNTDEPLANTSLIPNVGNTLQRRDRYGNLAVRYTIMDGWSLNTPMSGQELRKEIENQSHRGSR